MIDLTKETLSSLADLIQSGFASSEEVLRAHFERIEQLNPKLNAVVTLAHDAMEKAKAADVARAKGEVIGPLHGVPLTVKDTIDTAGLRTTSGSAIRADHVPAYDAPAVARLKAAGAIILGKTNTAEMAMDYTTENPVFGRGNNPFDLSLTTGGSSGGEAAAIATCMSPGGIGSDLAGSIRIPAHFCGVAGLKPTVGRVPGEGQCPAAFGPYSLGAVIGPMARSVRDLKLLFGVLAGIEPSTSVTEPKLDATTRVAFYTDDGVAPVTAETRQVVENTATALAEAGLQVKEKRPPGIALGHELWLNIFSRATVILLRNFYDGNEDKGGDFVRWRLKTADDTPTPSLDEYISLWRQRDWVRNTLVEWMSEFPLMILPVGATPAYAHGTLKVNVGNTTMNTFRAFSYSQTFNVFDLPVAVVRAGRTKDGLPVGVQIVGRPFAEDTVLAAAAIIEEALGGWSLPAV
ncbi:MAG TPA: amidase [Pyrinomonadaceae bacterium]|nr:amidase [Pyrinomonadaceae bacterium]